MATARGKRKGAHRCHPKPLPLSCGCGKGQVTAQVHDPWEAADPWGGSSAFSGAFVTFQ